MNGRESWSALSPHRCGAKRRVRRVNIEHTAVSTPSHFRHRPLLGLAEPQEFAHLTVYIQLSKAHVR